jgi:hypothetical protein
MKNKKYFGQSLAEFALILPMLLLLVMGVFDLGRGIYYLSTIHNAAREGARYGAVNHCDTIGIKNQAKAMAIGLDGGLNVKDPVKYYTPDGQVDRIKVIVEYDFDTVTPLVGTFLGESGVVKLKSEARQLVEMPMTCP